MMACFDDLVSGSAEGTGWTLPAADARAHEAKPKRHVHDALLWGGNLNVLCALVGTPSPLDTKLTSQFSTWLVDVPRICFTPSSTRLKPCTYASDMPPPDVFVGSRPSGHSSAPSLVNSAPSPRSQKP